jgi:hypothetical protein
MNRWFYVSCGCALLFTIAAIPQLVSDYEAKELTLGRVIIHLSLAGWFAFLAILDHFLYWKKIKKEDLDAQKK